MIVLLPNDVDRPAVIGAIAERVQTSNGWLQQSAPAPKVILTLPQIQNDAAIRA